MVQLIANKPEENARHSLFNGNSSEQYENETNNENLQVDANEGLADESRLTKRSGYENKIW